jgi:hypothetical protein
LDIPNVTILASALTTLPRSIGLNIARLFVAITGFLFVMLKKTLKARLIFSLPKLKKFEIGRIIPVTFGKKYGIIKRR